jgi:hypothetical protein
MANLESQPSVNYPMDGTLVKHMKASGIGAFDNAMSLQLYGSDGQGIHNKNPSFAGSINNPSFIA